MNNLSLFSEEAGRVLYKSYTFKKISLNVLSKLINGNHSTYSFSNGIFGVFWLIAHLRNKQLIKRDKDLFLQFNGICVTYILNSNFGFYDYMHGDLGVLLYLIETKDFDNIRRVFDKLIKNKVSYNSFNVYEERFSSKTFRESKINLSLSHGLASIMGICNILISNKLMIKRSQGLIIKFIMFYKSILNKESSGSLLPSFIIDGVPTEYIKRLAWCYGDLGVLYQLHWSATILQNKEDIEYFEEKLIETAKISFDEAQIKDAGFCHGGSGASYIFHKLFVKTGIKQFKESSDFWLKKSDEFLLQHNNKFYNLGTETWIEDEGLLTGMTGVNLVKDTISGKIDSTWDRCFLLS